MSSDNLFARLVAHASENIQRILRGRIAQRSEISWVYTVARWQCVLLPLVIIQVTGVKVTIVYHASEAAEDDESLSLFIQIGTVMVKPYR